MNMLDNEIPPFELNDRIVVIGEQLKDSEQENAPDGSSWVRRLNDMLIANNPTDAPEIIDRTTPEARLHTVRQRWVDDVLWYQPTCHYPYWSQRYLASYQ